MLPILADVSFAVLEGLRIPNPLNALFFV